ncbi:DUF4870 domain-containing protein [Kineosporia mesophila]|nr:DUF4870 domain-containing protein [Kineosporia mesophila]
MLPGIVIYSMYKDRSRYIKEQSTEAINFQICVLAAYFVAYIIDLLPVLSGFTLLVWGFSAIFSLIAAASAWRGDQFSYPVSRKFLH